MRGIGAALVESPGVAGRLLQQNGRRLACDAAALRQLGEQNRAAYGRTVLQVAARPQPVLQIVSTMGGGKRELKERLIRITEPRKKATALSFAAVLLVVCLVGCSFGNLSDAGTSQHTEFPEVQVLAADALTIGPDLVDAYGLAGPVSADVLGIKEPVSADLNHNGVPETIQVLYLENTDAWAISVSEEDSLIYSESANLYPGDRTSLFLCTVGGEDYLLRYQAFSGSHATYWDYAVFSLEGESEKNIDAIDMRFDGDEESRVHVPFNPAAGAVFLQNLRGYLENAHLLVSTCAEVNQAYAETGDWVVYPWEKNIPNFTYREDLSIDENLEALAAAASEAEPSSIALAGYYAVLAQNGIFRTAPFTKACTLDDVGDSLIAADFALQDLNADGVPELLLNFQDSAGMPAKQLILSWQVELMGYELPADAISNLRSNGSFQYRDDSVESITAWRMLLNEDGFSVLPDPAPVSQTVLGEGGPVTYYPVSQVADVLLKG